MVASIERANEIIEQLQSHNQELTKQLESSNRKLSMLQHQIDQLLRRIYGRRSEKMDPNQLIFDGMLEALENNNVPSPEEETLPVQKKKVHKAKRNHPGRIPIPEHLERVEIILDIPEQDKICPETGQELKQMGWEVSEKLEYRPGKLIVNVYKRPKYVSPDRAADLGVITAPMPDSPIEKCKADIGLLSHIIVSKFADHLPFYRQDGIFQRERVDIPRATQTSWCLQIYDSISPLEEVLKRVVLESGILFTDDSIIPLQVKGNGKVKKGRLWVYVRGGPGPPLVIFNFSPDRRKKRPLNFLADYQGYAHADAYSGYDELFENPKIIEVACWAHARRKFDEAVKSRPEEATDIMSRIARLYQVESSCKEMKPDDRYRVRQEKSKPLLDDIFESLETLKAKTIPQEPLRKAVSYTLHQQEALYRYLEDGWLKIDNNTSENAIRPLALGRKNWLFAGSERGAKATALFLSLIQSCKACDINPWEYFDDMLRRIMAHPVSKLRELLPDQWKPLPKDEHSLIINT